MRKLKRAVHLDFHTMPNVADFAAGFDARTFARTLKDAKVDFINVFAKCNLGFAYYPTEIGVPYPYMEGDMLGETVAECRKEGIGVAAYFNIGLDHEMARKHRDWSVVNKEGQVIWGDRTGNFFRLMCLNSGYRDYALGMIREVAERYPVDGVFLDCLVFNPCYGNECQELLQASGRDPLDHREVESFTRQTVIDFCRDVKTIVGNDRLLLPNGLGHVHSEGIGTHIEIECLPGAWGYDYFAAQAAYARTLGKQVLYMTGRFHANWGDFGGLKRKASLEYDCWDALMNGIGTSVGDHMHPRDGLDPAVYRLIGDVYADVEKLEPWTDGAAAVADIAVVLPEGSDLGANNPRFPIGHRVLYAAARMLGELKYTFDIVEERGDFSAYRLIVLPDEIAVTDTLKDKLERHLAAGGGIVSTGFSGLDPERTGFSIDRWRMDYLGPDPRNVSYYTMLERSERFDPDFRYAAYKQGIWMKGRADATEIASDWDAYSDKHWDGFHGYFYTPPARRSGRAAALRSGPVIQIAHRLFLSYEQHAYPEDKYLLDHCIRQLLPEPLVRCERIPSTARVGVTRKDGFDLVHVKTTYPELRGKYNVIEEHNVVTGGVVSLRGTGAKRVYTAPDRTPLPFDVADGYTRIRLPDVCGYAMIVVER
ncbi:alpha-amylase family protein [Paenibacillus sp. GYB003]|uniref:alpha-amylase family protein n=1 Tax=Paenibacillus sp. GYB003 TaxID=2994392 RepID=UPI002F968F2E